MKALSVQQPWASMIARGVKTIETRRWPTKHRGELLIVASRRPVIDGLPAGQAIAVVRVVGCRPMSGADERRACCALYDGAWAWELEGARPIEPFDVRGKLKLFEVEMPRRVGMKAEG